MWLLGKPGRDGGSWQKQIGEWQPGWKVKVTCCCEAGNEEKQCQQAQKGAQPAQRLFILDRHCNAQSNGDHDTKNEQY
jgi:hypothetical protein